MQELHNFPFPAMAGKGKTNVYLKECCLKEGRSSVRDGGVFIFINRRQNIMKILHMEYAGLVIYHKKLESGRFKLPSYDENTCSLNIHWNDLMMMVQSVKIRQGTLKRKS